MEIIAHRGASAQAPENTLSAVKLAWQYPIESVEIDIRQTKDGRIVAMHDATILRTTGVDLTVSRHSSDDLRALDAGRLKGRRFTGQRIPFLEEILETVPRGRTLFIEIKTPPEILPTLRRVHI